MDFGQILEPEGLTESSIFMCFSATASFTASFSLSVLGVATPTQTTSKKQLLLATFPLLFAIQQFFEGVVWLNLDNQSSRVYYIGIYVFLVFATAFWLIICPISVYLLSVLLFIFLNWKTALPQG
ncbi:DUF6629 family protein [Planktothrix agardhii]|jgi:heme/copper-type cytochrome/quinol oxidase subunit 4|uniref:Transmembrane protein n=2 Tax=Planktothrix agardhii TaxID=1160 RepID=A0A073CJL2_PLAA1|nr:DUF6629 family protein [Planktothrix agardhii]BBD55635.1 hypothetical protein NIES204_29510 [Planktothrix agardhii NIES-204]KEI68489.1 hypothetical protein A19Y_3748 [Planktothrix agardhii NIVA-CYA 126/8]MCB8758666.1 hypothetical protein [Planktothrix agardhii 1813]MCF3644188.1 hypothetical protein [Planktothrix agardhii 1026]CAD5933862.1 hypothetical protein NIVACYA_01921 [Planktothrix agardhii]